MATLRDPAGGCPWDREQTFATIAPYTIEEAYEVADAIERNDLADLEGELGDLLFQVVFHARMAEEAGRFDFGDVVAGICDKLRRRHPHVFDGTRVDDVAEQSRIWEEIKREERAEKRPGVLADVPAGLPGLSRAAKLGKRAAAVGFDWPDVAGVRAKLDEEIAELDEALAAAASHGRAAAPPAVAAEIGDLLFTVANLCRHLGLDPEDCARAANARFTRRFEHVEARVNAAGGDWSAHDAAALDSYWRLAKTQV
jgi:tetrapyrrole methylase family protein/MazG family protein/ATP diphosphatase